jgi:hypothetical protein
MSVEVQKIVDVHRGNDIIMHWPFVQSSIYKANCLERVPGLIIYLNTEKYPVFISSFLVGIADL